MDNDANLTDQQISNRRGALSRKAAQTNGRYLRARADRADKGHRVESARETRARIANQAAQDAIRAFNRQYPEA